MSQATSCTSLMNRLGWPCPSPPPTPPPAPPPVEVASNLSKVEKFSNMFGEYWQYTNRVCEYLPGLDYTTWTRQVLAHEWNSDWKSLAVNRIVPALLVAGTLCTIIYLATRAFGRCCGTSRAPRMTPERQQQFANLKGEMLTCLPRACEDPLDELVLHMKTSEGSDLLTHAIELNHPDWVSVLLNRGVSRDNPDSQGRDPLLLAAQHCLTDSRDVGVLQALCSGLANENPSVLNAKHLQKLLITSSGTIEGNYLVILAALKGLIHLDNYQQVGFDNLFSVQDLPDGAFSAKCSCPNQRDLCFRLLAELGEKAKEREIDADELVLRALQLEEDRPNYSNMELPEIVREHLELALKLFPHRITRKGIAMLSKCLKHKAYAVLIDSLEVKPKVLVNEEVELLQKVAQESPIRYGYVG